MTFIEIGLVYVQNTSVHFFMLYKNTNRNNPLLFDHIVIIKKKKPVRL